MSASAQMKSDFDLPEDKQLADDIARVMHHRPLMSRLARIEAAHAAAPGLVGQPASAAVLDPPEPRQRSQAPALPPDPRSIEEVIDDLPAIAKAPPSARWLDNARRDHRQARTRQVVAWATTLSIAFAIIGVALLLLRA